MRDLLRAFLREVDEAVFPSSIYCVCCGSLIDRSRMYSLCDDCIDKFHWITGRTCEACGKAMPATSTGRLCYDCMREEHFFTKGFSCLTYGLHERGLMLDLKYGGKGYLARIFGDIMFDRMEAEIRRGLFAPSGGGVRIHLIAPVPVSKSRLHKRGYNQAELMARQLACRWGECVRDAGGKNVRSTAGSGVKDTAMARLFPAPVFCPNLLRRAKETQMLRSLNPTERRMALQGAFVVSREGQRLLTPESKEYTGAPEGTADAVGPEGTVDAVAPEADSQGKNILLIDDIYTTGATADACSQAFLEGGAAAVYLLSLSSGGNRRPTGL